MPCRVFSRSRGVFASSGRVSGRGCRSSGFYADLVKVSGCNRRGSCARLPVPVCRFVSVSGSGCPAGSADPLRGSGSIALHCIIVLVTCSKILRF